MEYSVTAKGSKPAQIKVNEVQFTKDNHTVTIGDWWEGPGRSELTGFNFLLGDVEVT